MQKRYIRDCDHKDRLDPFLTATPGDVEKIHHVIDEAHDNFDAAVLQGRKGKLHGDPKDLFSGDFWTGQTALKLGLVGGLGNLSDVMQQEFQVSRVKDYSDSKNVLKMIFGQLGSILNLPLQSEHLQLLEKM